MQKLSVERAREMLAYDHDTGVIRWKTKPNNGTVKVGDVAGHNGPRGYLQIRLDGKAHIAHRIAWMIEKGVVPDGDIDHINGIKTDNRICNLRDVPKSINQQNRRAAQRNNKSGFLGVIQKKGKFIATISINGKCKQIGTFLTPQDAHAAYVETKRKHHVGNTL